ncbi:MAG: hypothetical protein ACOCZX_04860 [Candidatus Bipolaricaulota bacterium]
MDFTDVFVTWNEQKAELIRGLLEDYGIDCYLSSHISHLVHPVTVDGLAEIKVMVPKLREREARKLINTYFRPDKAQEEDDAP